MSKETPAHHLPVAHPPRRLWQKISSIIAKGHFVLAAIGVVVMPMMLKLAPKDLGDSK